MKRTLPVSLSPILMAQRSSSMGAFNVRMASPPLSLLEIKLRPTRSDPISASTSINPMSGFAAYLSVILIGLATPLARKRWGGIVFVLLREE